MQASGINPINEVKTYYLTPEELEAYRAMPKQTGKNLDGYAENNVNMALNSWKKRQNTVKSYQRPVIDWRWPQNR
ncbi:hypothetical protein A374_08884 [Fictibacillus macauensis ZFHKF-1]|uniref:Uncharacterized protein n=1 Tax=Fictibacillus macauensis ZFHKF-1 TaxID=1196324 RepID=I8UGI6_9BACL|nr:hypothetical protein A374_08884 [Fictibacillus macauensis ZFHKF-1]